MKCNEKQGRGMRCGGLLFLNVCCQLREMEMRQKLKKHCGDIRGAIEGLCGVWKKKVVC